jgi:ferrous iron transport protein A
LVIREKPAFLFLLFPANPDARPFGQLHTVRLRDVRRRKLFTSHRKELKIVSDNHRVVTNVHPPPETGVLPLSELPIGTTGRVTGLTAGGNTRRRLLDLGLVPGTPVKAVRRSAFGDPTAFLIRGTTLALRSEEAKEILVRQDPVVEDDGLA